MNIILIPAWGMNAASFSTLLAELLLSIIAAYYCRDIIRITWNKEFTLGLIGAFIVIIVNKVIVEFYMSNLVTIFVLSL